MRRHSSEGTGSRRAAVQNSHAVEESISDRTVLPRSPATEMLIASLSLLHRALLKYRVKIKWKKGVPF